MVHFQRKLQVEKGHKETRTNSFLDPVMATSPQEPPTQTSFVKHSFLSATHPDLEGCPGLCYSQHTLQPTDPAVQRAAPATRALVRVEAAVGLRTQALFRGQGQHGRDGPRRRRRR